MSHCHKSVCQCNPYNIVVHTCYTWASFHGQTWCNKGRIHPIITHNILIILVLLCRCGPYMCRYVFPRTIWRVPNLSSNQKLLQMQEYTHLLMQLGTGSPPYVPYDAPIPHACEQVLNMCPKETLNHIVLLLSLGKSLSYPQLKGPQRSVGVRIPNSRGHTKALQEVVPPCALHVRTPTAGVFPKRVLSTAGALGSAVEAAHTAARRRRHVAL